MGFMTMKLDMSKTYDRVEWDFLLKLMRKMGFQRRWINLISACISTVTYSILVNGEPNGNITPTRGITQGDPIAPYLFLLCSEGLTGLIRQAVQEKKIRGFSLCKGGPKISHLFFADDSLFFCRAQMGDIQSIQNILERYERASGQQVNKSKAALFFSTNVSTTTKHSIQEVLGIPEVKEYEKYLGLPAVVGKNKRAGLNFIKDRVWGKIQGWKEKLLS